MQKEIGTCSVCEEPLLCAPGQIIRFHGQCRAEGRRLYGKSKGVKQFDINEQGSLVPKIVVK